MTEKQKLAILNAIIDLNAALLGQEPRIRAFVSKSSRGRIAVAANVGLQAKYYSDIDAALAAGWDALGKAREAHDRLFPKPRRDDA